MSFREVTRFGLRASLEIRDNFSRATLKKEQSCLMVRKLELNNTPIYICKYFLAKMDEEAASSVKYTESKQTSRSNAFDDVTTRNEAFGSHQTNGFDRLAQNSSDSNFGFQGLFVCVEIKDEHKITYSEILKK